MDRLMELHAQKKATAPPKQDEGPPRPPRREPPVPIGDVAAAYELDDRPATLICPQCGNERTGKVPRLWWYKAEEDGTTNPWWKIVCPGCDEVADAQKRDRDRPKGESEAPPLQLPMLDL